MSSVPALRPPLVAPERRTFQAVQASDAEAVLVVRSLSKRFGDLQVLDNLSLTIRRGEIFALLGSNGAGKSTLIGCLTGSVRKDAGQISLFGCDLELDAYSPRFKIGVVPQEIIFDPVFTLRQSLWTQMGYYGLKPDPSRIEEMLEVFQLTGKGDRSPARLSGGMRRRLLAAKALIHRPELIFLDEPTAGVDVEQRKTLWKYVRRLRDEGATIVLTTHHLDEVEQLADRVGILNGGRLAHVESTGALLRRSRRILHVGLKEPLSGLPAEVSAAGAELSTDGVEIQYVEAPERPPATRVVQALYVAGANIAEMELRRAPFEEILLQIMHQPVQPAPDPGPMPATAQPSPRRLNSRGMFTLLIKEVWRFLRLPFGTIIAPLIGTMLNLIVFGGVGVNIVGVMRGANYLEFIIPGLFVAQLASSAFYNASTSIFDMKARGTMMDLLVAPLRPAELLTAWVLAGAIRGLFVSGIVLASTAWLMNLAHPQWLAFAGLSLLTAFSFASLGVLAGLWAEKPEQITRVNALFLVPLSQFAGVYFAVERLPQPWSTIARFDPLLYVVEGIRQCLIGRGLVPIQVSMAVGSALAIGLVTLALKMVALGYKVRT